MRIIVVGGGASGVACAIQAKREGYDVVILERNDRLLKKILVTGNGRCNYMHEAYNTSDYHSQNMEYIEDFISEKNINDVRYFFDSMGIISKNRNGYIYPFSNQASTIRDALVREVNRLGIDVYYDVYVERLEKRKDQFFIHTASRDYYCDKVVLATGSFAYPKTGSDGFGYNLLQEMGHTIIKPLPALVQLVSDFNYCKIWDGVRCDAILTLVQDDTVICEEEGEVQLTDYGISGICTFNLSHDVVRGLYDGKKEVIKINFVPFMDALPTVWMDRYSKKVIDVLLKVCHIREDISYEDLNNDMKILLCNNLKGLEVNITGSKDYNNCQVCNGGVSLKEINMDTMESKYIDGLYIIGELLDINGNCGGFNLTECWISGILAGKSLGSSHDFIETN